MKGKKIIRKNQVIATGLAVMIAVAGYLTYANQSREKQAGTEINPDSEQILLQGAETGVDIVSPEEGQDEGSGIQRNRNRGQSRGGRAGKQC